MNVSDLIATARAIATEAHKGQYRADGATPYITHPERVAHLVRQWAPYLGFDGSVDEMVAAALLHDVVEDTEITLTSLAEKGIPVGVIYLVDLLTKPDDSPATPAYYERIRQSRHAMLIKIADRFANIESAVHEVRAGRNVERWNRYLEKTRRDVLPMYEGSEWYLPRFNLETQLVMLFGEIALQEAPN